MLSSQRSLVDHVIVAVRDLAAASARYEELGFALSDRGSHPTRGTVNRCIVLRNAYIELLATAAPDSQELFLRDFLERREGACSIAFAMQDPQQAFETVGTAVPGLEPPIMGSRLINSAQGAQSIAFDVLRIPADALLPGRFFFCHHRNAQRVFEAPAGGHPNGARRLTRILIAAQPQRMAWPAALEGLGFRLLEASAERLRVDCRGVEIAFLSPGAVRREISEAEMPTVPDEPAIVLLEIEADHAHRIGSEDAHGIVLAFTAPR